MDGQSLQSMWESGSPFLAQMGEQAWNQDKQKAQQALLAAQGQEQRAQAMQPLEQAHKQALTRQGNANAASVEDSMAAQVPAAERLKQKMLEFHSKGTELERSQREADMYERGQNAAIIKANGGQIPVWLLSKIPQNELQMYQGKGLDTTMNILKAYHETHPKTMEARAKQANDLERARIAAGPGYARAANDGGSKEVKTNFEQEINRLNRMADAEPDEGKKLALQAQADRVELMMHRKIRAATEARKEGDPDLSGRMKTVPVKEPTATPRDNPTSKPLTYKTPDDVKAAFKSGKLTKEQAIQLLQKEHGMQ